MVSLLFQGASSCSILLTSSTPDSLIPLTISSGLVSDGSYVTVTRCPTISTLLTPGTRPAKAATRSAHVGQVIVGTVNATRAGAGAGSAGAVPVGNVGNAVPVDNGLAEAEAEAEDRPPLRPGVSGAPGEPLDSLLPHALSPRLVTRIRLSTAARFTLLDPCLLFIFSSPLTSRHILSILSHPLRFPAWTYPKTSTTPPGKGSRGP